MGHFIRPKDTNKDAKPGSKTNLKAEDIGVVQDYEDEYIETTGFDSGTDGISGGKHHKDPTRREAARPYQTRGRAECTASHRWTKCRNQQPWR